MRGEGAPRRFHLNSLRCSRRLPLCIPNEHGKHSDRLTKRDGTCERLADPHAVQGARWSTIICELAHSADCWTSAAATGTAHNAVAPAVNQRLLVFENSRQARLQLWSR